MNIIGFISGIAVVACACIVRMHADNKLTQGRKTVPLALELPPPAYISTPVDFVISEHMEPCSLDPRPPIHVVEGVVNLSLGKPVTSSDANPICGELKMVTDGLKEATDESYVELRRKTQWVQIDLEQMCELYAVAIWHAHNAPMFYHSVVVQLADDACFTCNVRTIFNNDYQNANGLGIGKDKEYFESYQGKLIAVNGKKARYLRAYSRGSTFSVLNRYTEIEIHGLPAGVQ